MRRAAVLAAACLALAWLALGRWGRGVEVPAGGEVEIRCE